jgi:hypothetical protein
MTINNIILTSSYPTKIFSSQLAHRIWWCLDIHKILL